MPAPSRRGLPNHRDGSTQVPVRKGVGEDRAGRRTKGPLGGSDDERFLAGRYDTGFITPEWLEAHLGATIAEVFAAGESPIVGADDVSAFT